MLCKRCGAEIPDNAQECEFCGMPVAPQQQDETINQNEENRRKQIDKMMEDKRAQLDEIKQRRDDKRLRQRRMKVAGITAACVIGAAALGGGGYYIYGTVTGKSTPVQTTPSPVPATPRPTAIIPTFTPMPTITPGASPAATAIANAATENNASWASTGNRGTGRSPSNGSSSSNGSSGNSSSGSSSGGSSSSGSSSGGSSGGSSSGSVSSGSSSGSSGSSSSGNTNAVSVRNSGVTSSVLSSQLAVGNEVVHDGDNWYMTFTSGGVKYYATVNPGATTEQVKNVEYTLNAEPTGATYNGNTVYEITSMTKYNGQDYILPKSGTQLLTKSDLSGLSKDDLALARNEIYARHGRRFMTSEYQKYFESKPWYHESSSYNYDDDNANLNDIEIKNVQFIIDNEN